MDFWPLPDPCRAPDVAGMLVYSLQLLGMQMSARLFSFLTLTAVLYLLLQIATLIGADAKEIVFTSGATESNNLAVKGVANFHKDKKRHIITTQTEHKCVLDSCR